MSIKSKAATRNGLCSAISTIVPINPLEKRVLGAAIADVLLTMPVYPLLEAFPFRGSGVYAIYYSGTRFGPYAPLTQQNSGGNCVWPIYLGQALPSGEQLGAGRGALALRSKMMKHARRIVGAPLDFSIDDFSYRALVMDDTFIRLAEKLLTALYKPLWNSYVDGFDHSTLSSNSGAFKCTRWDTLHGDRNQTEIHANRGETRMQLITEIRQELASTNYEVTNKLVN